METVTVSQMKLALAELELRLVREIDDKLSEKASVQDVRGLERVVKSEIAQVRKQIEEKAVLPKAEVEKIARQAVEKGDEQSWTGKSHIITITLLVVTIANVVAGFIFSLLHT